MQRKRRAEQQSDGAQRRSRKRPAENGPQQPNKRACCAWGAVSGRLLTLTSSLAQSWRDLPTAVDRLLKLTSSLVQSWRDLPAAVDRLLPFCEVPRQLPYEESLAGLRFAIPERARARAQQKARADAEFFRKASFWDGDVPLLPLQPVRDGWLERGSPGGGAPLPADWQQRFYDGYHKLHVQGDTVQDGDGEEGGFSGAVHAAPAPPPPPRAPAASASARRARAPAPPAPPMPPARSSAHRARWCAPSGRICAT